MSRLKREPLNLHQVDLKICGNQIKTAMVQGRKRAKITSPLAKFIHHFSFQTQDLRFYYDQILKIFPDQICSYTLILRYESA